MTGGGGTGVSLRLRQESLYSRDTTFRTRRGGLRGLLGFESQIKRWFESNEITTLKASTTARFVVRLDRHAHSACPRRVDFSSLLFPKPIPTPTALETNQAVDDIHNPRCFRSTPSNAHPSTTRYAIETNRPINETLKNSSAHTLTT